MRKANDVPPGTQEKCDTCGTLCTAALIPATDKYPAKVQWQVDGKAHFNYDKNTKTVTCPGTKGNVEVKVKKLDDNYIPEGTDQIKAVLPSQNEEELGVKELEFARTLVEKAFLVAHKLTRTYYPNLPENTHTFGQIRCKFIDHLLQAKSIG